MGGRSNSSSDTTYEDRRTSNTIGVESGGGDAMVGDGNSSTKVAAGSIVGEGNSITNYDMSADVAGDAFASAGDMVLDGFDFSEAALAEGSDLTRDIGQLMGDTANSALTAMQDTAAASNDLAIGAVSEGNNLSRDVTSLMSESMQDALMFADSSNFYLSDTLGRNADRTQDTLLGLAQMQERGLDNALDVAQSFGTNDGAEVAGDAVKYIGIAAAVGFAAMMFAGGRK